MAGLEIRSGDKLTIPEPLTTEADLFLLRAVDILGNSYHLQKKAQQDQVTFDPRTFIHTEIQVIKHGPLGFTTPHLGAKTLLTFLADGHFVREIEAAAELKKAVRSHLIKIEGYVMGDGVDHIYDVPEKDEIPKRLQEAIEISGIPYFMKKHVYLYNTDPWSSVRALEKEFANRT